MQRLLDRVEGVERGCGTLDVPWVGSMLGSMLALSMHTRAMHMRAALAMHTCTREGHLLRGSRAKPPGLSPDLCPDHLCRAQGKVRPSWEPRSP